MVVINKNENLIDKKVLNDICEKFNLNKLVAEILVNRGINSLEKVDKFLNDDINMLKDPFLMLNMRDVTNRIVKAIENKEKILIFGDYDVDGISAASIMYLFLKTKTDFVDIYLPNRFEDGYGLSCPCIDKIAKKEKPDLIITVDCGISCEKEVEFVKQMGTDIIVTDHHVLPEKLPNCLLINTKFEQAFNFNGLCGAGVALEIVRALCIIYRENFERFLPIAALATIADIVPLCDENRIIVKEGLKRIDMLPLGVKILLKDTFGSLKNISSTDIAYKIAPKINSAGRLDDANIALKLFISDDLKVINKSLRDLERLNNLRKELCEKIFVECKRLVKSKENKNIIVLYNKNWDIGVLGIVCAKLCDEFGLPVILFGENSGELKGSCRTIGNVDAVKIFENSKDLLISFGGHQKAGGLSIKEENLQKFILRSQEFLEKTYNKSDFLVEKHFDLSLSLSDIDANFVKQLKILEPCGFENPSPVFKIDFKQAVVSKMNKNPQHLMINAGGNVDFLAFNDSKNYENYLNFSDKTILAELGIKKYKNKETVKGIIKYSSFKNLNLSLNEKLKANYLSQLTVECSENYKPKYYTSLKQIENLFNEKTIIISYDYNKNLENLNANLTSFCVNDFNNFNILYGLKKVDDLKHYNRIVLTEKPIDENFVNFLHSVSNAIIYVPENDNFSVKVEPNREKLLEVYYLLIKAINKNTMASDIYSYYEILLTKFGAKFDFVTFYFAMLVFEELNLVIKKQNENEKIYFKLNKIKTDLENSKIFNKMKIL